MAILVQGSRLILVQGSRLTEIGAGGKEYLRTERYDKMDVTVCDTLLKENTI